MKNCFVHGTYRNRNESKAESNRVHRGLFQQPASADRDLPGLGIEVSIGENLAIGLVFTGVSIIRSYALRRVFEGIRTA